MMMSKMKMPSEQKKKYVAPNMKAHELLHQTNLLQASGYHGTFGMIHAEETIERS